MKQPKAHIFPNYFNSRGTSSILRLRAILWGGEKYFNNERMIKYFNNSHPKYFKHSNQPKLFQTVAEVDLAPLGSLEYLDLSRNLIQEIMPGTFMGMANLKGLDFSVNVVRKVRMIVDQIFLSPHPAEDFL